jgi:hypothetical protein
VKLGYALSSEEHSPAVAPEQDAFLEFARDELLPNV